MSKKKFRNVRLDEWMDECIREVSEAQKLDQSEWIRKVLADALAQKGLTQAVYYNRRAVRARKAVQDNLERRGE